MQSPGNITPDAHAPADDSGIQVMMNLRPSLDERTHTNYLYRFSNRSGKHKKPRHPTSHDTVSNLDTAFNPSSPPQFTKDIPSTVLRIRTRPTSKKRMPLLGKSHRMSFTISGNFG